MYRLGKFSRGTPKIFAPLIKGLSFLPSMLFTVIPWRTWRWKRITLLSVTFMLINGVKRKSVHNSNLSLTKWTSEGSFIMLIPITWGSGGQEVAVLCSGYTCRVVNMSFGFIYMWVFRLLVNLLVASGNTSFFLPYCTQHIFTNKIWTKTSVN